ncbi:MAG TPA: PDR/VanB family oxidoreductase [Ideonella sp.]|uniref:PDR/VanB family oxidoreductase n=1 Tax=Ideonella sp. TaxID=1929293 RepID=UPI002C1F7C41|nr:PDR/VanB family oxidoreductase [Ideonella sp.]HSI47314.1 PDR/VanB family oxidoreductase [Ideonella sp.]
MKTPDLPLLRVRVARKQAVADDICSFDLVPADGAALPAFSAGAHIDVHLAPAGASALVRQYSLCNAPGETHRYQIGVLREASSRGGSRTLHDEVREGQLLSISAPRNHFPLVPQASHSLLLAGGIGITPMLAMAEHLAAAGEAFTLHYCARSRSRAAFIDRLDSARHAAQVVLHFDDEAPAQRLQLEALLAVQPPGTHLYVCGPKGFIEAVLGTARAQGWPEAQLHCEFFSADAGPRDGDAAFEVELASSGRVVHVPKGQSIAQALAAAGEPVMVSCEQGVCGTCLTGVKAGLPDHRDAYLTPEEQAANDQMLICCSRSKSARLVLGL